MQYEKKPLPDGHYKGSLKKNEKREQSWHAVMKGSIIVDGVAYWVDVSPKKEGEWGEWWPITLRRKEEQEQAPRQKPLKPLKPAPSREPDEDFNDEIPY